MFACDSYQLLHEIDRVYKEHYEKSNDQTVHDIFRAVKRRIRRYTKWQNPELVSARYVRSNPYSNKWDLQMFFVFYGRSYQLMLSIPKEIFDPNCLFMEVKR